MPITFFTVMNVRMQIVVDLRLEFLCGEWLNIAQLMFYTGVCRRLSQARGSIVRVCDM